MTRCSKPPHAGAGDERRELLSELFHALNQPLTTLRCALELELLQSHREPQSRHTIETALRQSERLAQLSSGIRALVEASEAGDQREPVALDSVLRDTVLDFQPVAESAGLAFEMDSLPACHVEAEPKRLRQAVFSLLEWLLESAAPGATVTINLAIAQDVTIIRMATSLKDAVPVPNPAGKLAPPPTDSLPRRLQLAIARSIFEAAGGDLEVANGNRRLQAIVRLGLGPAHANTACPCGSGGTGQE